jgi:hypothetical protein
MKIYMSPLLCLIGALVYLLLDQHRTAESTRSRLMELGRLLFWVGLLVFLMRSGPDVLYSFGK